MIVVRCIPLGTAARKLQIKARFPMNRVVFFRPDNTSNRFRKSRFKIFKSLVVNVVARKNSCRILDIGGTLEYWRTFQAELDWSKVDVTLVNLGAEKAHLQGFRSLPGDARDLSRFDDGSFDIVHSNSVIEHVGRWGDMAAMAGEVRRLAPAYFVQTPYFWFPMEPHARTLFLHWMPESWRYRLLMRRTRGFWRQQPDVGSAMTAIQSALLLDRQQLQFLFPDAKIVSERCLGLTKSLIAIRDNNSPSCRS
jgi:hypothetical protein